MADSRLTAFHLPRRRLLHLVGVSAAVAAGTLTSCSPDRSSEDSGGPVQLTQAGDTNSADAPDVTAAPITVSGQTVEPVTGIRLTLPGEVRALTPERVGDGRAQVTYVWTGEDDWSYLVVEGPHSFGADDQSAALIAANAERQRLIAALITPSEPKTLEWEALAQCVQMTWSQTTVPPGWSQETRVDAIALLCVAEERRAYTLVAYGARGALENAYAYAAVCSAMAPEHDEGSEG